jgi:hypothetical protein
MGASVSVPTPQSHPESWDLFRECRPFTALPPAALQEMFATAEERTYQAGDALLRQGDPGDALLVLLEGSARARLRDEHGSHWVGRFTSGDVVGEMALVTREPRTADVIAESPVRVLLLPTATFDRLATRHLELCMVLTNVVADRLGQGARDGLGGKVVDAFRIVRCVGRGGMAVVYEAVEGTTGERVALKMMSHRLIYDSAALARFRQEAELVRSLEHENIARLQRLFPAYGTYFLVMEFCEGSTLADLVSRHGAFPEDQAKKILGQLAAATRAGEAANVASAAERALFLAIERATGLKARGILKTELATTLAHAQVPRELAELAAQQLGRCDELRFAGEAVELLAFSAQVRALCQQLGQTKLATPPGETP